MSVTTKFVTTTSEKLNTISVVNGQVIALSDRDAWFYDMGSTRHMIASNAYITSLPATGAENTLYVLAAASGDSGLYIYDGSAFVKIAGLKATSATQDSAGNIINTTYVKGVTASKSGSTVTFTVTKGDDSTSTFAVTDTDTTYDPMTAATADAAGKEGLVPAPAAGDQSKFLAGNATWQEAVTPSGAQALTNKTYEGYTLGNASEKTVAATVGEGGTGLPTAGAVYTALQSILDDAKDYTDTAISGVVQFNIKVVSALPTSDIKTHTIYLVPNGESTGSNVKTEYLYINGSWEIIGSTDIDLTPYVEINSLKNKGNSTTPIYFDANGVPVAISFSVNKTVPADAVFTDTTYDEATTSDAGLMSAADKTKLNGIAAKATANSAYTNTPAMNGTGSAGTNANYSRGDHVHPTDTSRAPTSHASAQTTYGTGTSTNYGHVKLSDAHDSTSGASSGIAATPAAVKAAYDLANGKQSALTFDDTPTANSNNPVKSNGIKVALDAKTSGPASSTDKGLAAFSGTTGKTLAKAVAAGSVTKGIYLNANGVPTEVTYSVNKDVPADAVFTDTTYTPASAAPKMDGTAAVGTSVKYSREDHIHPVDTSRAPTSHAATAATYGAGNATNYGHVKLSDAVDSDSSVSGGTAATPKAIKTVQDDLNAKLGTSVVDHTVYLGSVFSISNHKVSV